jgi:hypothetical protein
MSTEDREAIERALESEQHIARRQELLKKLWRIKKREYADEEERRQREVAAERPRVIARTLAEAG